MHWIIQWKICTKQAGTSVQSKHLFFFVKIASICLHFSCLWPFHFSTLCTSCLFLSASFAGTQIPVRVVLAFSLQIQSAYLPFARRDRGNESHHISKPPRQKQTLFSCLCSIHHLFTILKPVHTCQRTTHRLQCPQTLPGKESHLLLLMSKCVCVSHFEGSGKTLGETGPGHRD